MSEIGEVIIGLCILVMVYVLTRRVHAWRIKRAYQVIIQDLKQKEALDEKTAIELPYARQKIFRVGVRDFRPKALEFLIAGQIVGMNEKGRYYLIKREVADTDEG